MEKECKYVCLNELYVVYKNTHTRAYTHSSIFGIRLNGDFFRGVCVANIFEIPCEVESILEKYVMKCHVYLVSSFIICLFIFFFEAQIDRISLSRSVFPFSTSHLFLGPLVASMQCYLPQTEKIQSVYDFVKDTVSMSIGPIPFNFEQTTHSMPKNIVSSFFVSPFFSLRNIAYVLCACICWAFNWRFQLSSMYLMFDVHSILLALSSYASVWGRSKPFFSHHKINITDGKNGFERERKNGKKI